MTHSITELTHSIRERLAIAMFCDTDDCPASEWERAEEGKRNIYRSNVDAVFNEHLVSEGMIEAVQDGWNRECDTVFEMETWEVEAILKAAIQHIRDGGQ